MVQVSYPGVYVQEVSSGARTITGVSTSIALFVGRTERGVMNKPTRLFNHSEFTRKFGNSTATGELATAVRLFFNNGGTQAYVMRIAQGATQAALTIKNIDGSADAITLTAREAGKRGDELRVAIDYNTPTPDSTFNLRVLRVDPASLQESEQESHTNLSMVPGSARYAPDVINQDSALVTAEDPLGTSSAAGYSIGARVLLGEITDAETILGGLMGGLGWTLRIEIDGTDVHDVPVTGGDLATPLGAYDVDVSYPVIVADTSFLVQLTRSAAGTVRVLSSGVAKDVAAVLQMGPSLGGIEVTRFAENRPAPSGVRASAYGTALAQLKKISVLNQALYENLTVTVVGYTAVTGINLNTAAGEFYNGPASSVPSLRNVRHMLVRLASQFNAKAPNLGVPWRAEVQGFYLLFRPTSGDANTGLNADIASDSPTGLFATLTGFEVENQNTRYYALGESGQGDFQTGTDGDEGTFPGPEDYAAAYEIIDREVDIFNLLVLPRDAGIDDPIRKDIWGPASAFCQKRRAFLLVDPPKTWHSPADITGATISINTLRQGLVKDHSGVYWPRLLAPNEHGLIKPVDPSGAIAGMMARIDSSRGIFKAPAGIEADIRAISGIERQVSDPENGVTNALAVNTIRVFPNGIVSWGARTMDGFDNSGNDDYKYVPIRRLALFLGESLQRGLKFAVFEPNDEPLWAQIRLAAGAFMNGLFRQGAFQGQKKSDAYFVKVDAETTTQNDINLGIVNIIVGFAPLKPAEFVVVQIQQIAGQIQT
jgi:phage tail sheath protein FI